MRTSKILRMGLAALVAGGLVATAPAAMAARSGGGDRVTKRGSCSASADWKLDLRREDGGRIEVQFEVEHAKPGSTWNVRLSDNGTVFFRGTRTAGSLGAFQVRRLTKDLAGSDRIVGRAANQATGEICQGSATL